MLELSSPAIASSFVAISAPLRGVGSRRRGSGGASSGRVARRLGERKRGGVAREGEPMLKRRDLGTWVEELRSTRRSRRRLWGGG